MGQVSGDSSDSLPSLQVIQLLSGLESFSNFQTQLEFQAFCSRAAELWIWKGPVSNAEFLKKQAEIEANKDGTFKTPWGGVVITKHEHPLVEKFLVVKSQGRLAYEKHSVKEEKLQVIEGCGLLVHRPPLADKRELLFLKPDVTIHLSPGHEHCVIGLSELLIHESGRDYKGMDQDLIFLFEPIN